MTTFSIRPDQVFLAAGYTDLRLGIDGLAALVEYNFHLDPRSSALFLFCGRRTDRIKALYWQGDGFLLLYKRLDNGRFKWPRDNSDMTELTPQQVKWLLEGLTIHQKTSIHMARNPIELSGLDSVTY